MTDLVPAPARPSARPPRAGRVRDLPARAWARLGRLPRETWLVATFLVAQQALLFGGYWSGALTPPWDFYGSYTAEAFAWWADGSFFDPPAWMPYQWGGYAAAASVQNSAWYLPVGATAAVGGPTVRVAAVLSALHVALGALGAYVLVRRWVGAGAPAVFALVAYGFATPFFANASHVDIARAAAWLPWVVLIASPRWPWRRWWSVPAAAVLLWQFAVSSYPGVVVMAAYAILAVVLVWQLGERTRPRDHLVPLLVAGAAAVGLSLVKYLPTALVRGTEGLPPTRVPTFDKAILATTFLPFDVDFLPMDVTMRSFFVVAPVLVLVAFAPFRRTATRAALALVLVPAVLGLPRWPWWEAVAALPALGISRFRMMDARTVLVLGLVVLAAAGLAAVLARAAAGTDDDASRLPAGRSPLADRVRAAWLGVVPAGALLLAVVTPYSQDQWLVPWTIVAASAVAVGLARSGPRPWAATAVIALAVVSGTHWAAEGTRAWRVDRVRAETGHWGATSDVLAAQRPPAATEQRPARLGLEEGATDQVAWAHAWNTAYWTGDATVTGSLNLKGTESFDLLRATITAPETFDELQAFWAGPGGVVPEGLDAEKVARCTTTGDCGALVVTPTGYEPGLLTYHVAAVGDVAVAFNEAWYEGWELTACEPAGECRAIDVAPVDGAVGATLPAGEWDLSLEYRTPGQGAGWVAFGVGAALATAYPLVRRWWA